MKLERDKLEPNRYAYLSVRDSEMYDRAYGREDEYAKIVVRLLEEKAAETRSQHAAVRY